MRIVDVRTGIAWLEREECLRLLAEEEVGRLAVVEGRMPVIFPVNYALDGDAVVIRTDAGTKLGAAGRAPACFEVDRIDRRCRTGWSVLVTGRLEEVTPWDTEAFRRVTTLPVGPWAEGEKAHWLRLAPGRISGRRIGPAA